GTSTPASVSRFAASFEPSIASLTSLSMLYSLPKLYHPVPDQLIHHPAGVGLVHVCQALQVVRRLRSDQQHDPALILAHSVPPRGRNSPRIFFSAAGPPHPAYKQISHRPSGRPASR